MKKQGFYIKIYSAFIVSLLLMLTGCKQMSEKTTDTSVGLTGFKQMSEKLTDTSAGLNGGFEISKNGLPVNWIMYTPSTVKEGDFKIVIDKINYKEGKQSLKFDVKECSSNGGRHSPGFTNEFFDKKEGQYKLSFWIKNNGAKFSIKAGGVSAFTGSMKNIIKSNEQIENWKLFEYTIDVQKKEWFRIELNILKPGVFWIDDIKIEKK